ncbi:MAG: feruloyl-CoA synthase [Saprospiraceae bacterium]|nr:feruloyl-CoA synthase [Saprospiraceae bacterium]
MNLKKTPFLKIPTIDIDIQQEVRDGGVILLKSAVALQNRPHRMTERLVHWAEKTPDRVFIGQVVSIDGVTQSHPVNNQTWQTLTYAETFEQVKCIAQFLLDSGVSPEKPLVILSGNSIEHGLMSLAALHVGLPYSPLAPAYALRSTDYEKLRHTIDLLQPGLVFVQNGREYEKALHAVAPGVPVIAVNDPLDQHHVFSDLLTTKPTPAVDLAFQNIQPETIAKILFTSGSTGLPKGVINTHGNITANWQQITQSFPFMADGGLTLVDWLPWNHTFGGNHNFGLTLFNGGSLYIDHGNPTPKGIEATLQNLRGIAPTVYFNVPKGFEEIIPHLRKDDALRGHFFSQLQMFFYAGAGLPQHVWDDLEELAFQTTGKRLLIGTGLGMTEGSPSCLFNVHFGSFSGMIGVPVPGLEVKLVSDGGKLEARFRGPNISPGYWRNPEATAKAFDEEGFYRTGDALKFVDPDDPNAGMVFDGRIAEDFKLGTGTWVNVGVLKARLITAGKGLIQDAVITGHGHSFLGAIIFPELKYCKKLAGLDDDAGIQILVQSPAVLEALQTVLNDFALQSTGSSTLIKRAVFADFTLSIDKGEITDKGSINQRAILANRADWVEKIYKEPVSLPVLEAANT